MWWLLLFRYPAEFRREGALFAFLKVFKWNVTFVKPQMYQYSGNCPRSDPTSKTTPLQEIIQKYNVHFIPTGISKIFFLALDRVNQECKSRISFLQFVAISPEYCNTPLAAVNCCLSTGKKENRAHWLLESRFQALRHSCRNHEKLV